VKNVRLLGCLFLFIYLFRSIVIITFTASLLPSLSRFLSYFVTDWYGYFYLFIVYGGETPSNKGVEDATSLHLGRSQIFFLARTSNKALELYKYLQFYPETIFVYYIYFLSNEFQNSELSFSVLILLWIPLKLNLRKNKKHRFVRTCFFIIIVEL
jgi:hypothetical protein